MEPVLLTIAETAALLRVSVDTVRRSIKTGIIPCKRIRTNVRISRAWLDSYVAECAPMLLTRRQVSVRLGVTKYVVDSLRRRGLLPTVKVAGRAMVPASAVNEYVKRNTFAFLRSTRQAGANLAPRPASLPNLVNHPASWAESAQHRRTVFSNVRGV